MNWKQKMVLWFGIVVFVLLTLYPPIFVQQQYETSAGAASYREITAYEWLFDISGQKMNYDRLLMQWAIVLAVTVGGLSTFKEHTPAKRIAD